MGLRLGSFTISARSVTKTVPSLLRSIHPRAGTRCSICKGVQSVRAEQGGGGGGGRSHKLLRRLTYRAKVTARSHTPRILTRMHHNMHADSHSHSHSLAISCLTLLTCAVPTSNSLSTLAFTLALALTLTLTRRKQRGARAMGRNASSLRQAAQSASAPPGFADAH